VKDLIFDSGLCRYRSVRAVRSMTGVIVAVFIVFAGVFVTKASAQEGCAWYGSRPLCDGQCPAGSVYTGQRQACFTGSRRFCCPSRYVRNAEGLSNCKWTGSPGSMLYVCDDPEWGPYAAVAIDSKGRWGASIMPPSLDGPLATKNRARADALKRCGSGCSVVVSGKGQCVAVSESKTGGYWIGYAYGATRQFVTSAASRGCADRAPNGTCRVTHANCL
jgi:hypothetical protein